MANIFLGMPTYDGTAHCGAQQRMLLQASRDHNAAGLSHNSSAITMNMNALYCMALNARQKHNVTHFAMLHSDCEPAPFWLDVLMDELQEHDADFISAISPVKDDRGITSTGIGHPDHPWSPFTRLTQAQKNHPDFPDTFDIGGCVDGLARLPDDLKVIAPKTQLLVNTGAMVMRIDREWAEELCFTIADRIFKIGDKFVAKFESEDWRFGKAIAEKGGKVMSTRLVSIEHHGVGTFRSEDTWGNKTDVCCAKEIEYAEIYSK